MRNNIVDDENMRCIDCGRIVKVVDFYARNSFRRCPECQKKHRRAYEAERAKENRRKARQLRDEEKKQNALLNEKNRLLETEVQQLRHIVKCLYEQIESISCHDPITCREDIIEHKRKKQLV